jgi:hypothetical protein
MQSRNRFPSTKWLFTAVMFACLTSAASAQSAHIGARVGYNFDAEDVLFGLNLTVPVTTRIDFYPSIDVYTPDDGSMLGFNGDFKVRFPTISGPSFYVGGGIGVLNSSFDGRSATDVGVNLLMGLETRTGWVHPFAEGRILIRDGSSFQLTGGVNFTLGR